MHLLFSLLINTGPMVACFCLPLQQEVTGYMVPTEVINNGNNEILEEGGSDSGGHNSLSHATRISPATVRLESSLPLLWFYFAFISSFYLN
jgi:hypothetical protein